MMYYLPGLIAAGAMILLPIVVTTIKYFHDLKK